MYRPDLLAKKISDSIIPNYNKYYKKGIIIHLMDDSILIKISNKEFIINILESNNNIVWEIKNHNTLILESIHTEFDNIIDIILNI